MKTSSTARACALLWLLSSGLTAQLLATPPLAPEPLESPGASFGSDLADAGDVDGDGLRDLAVACAGDFTVRVFSGRDRTPLLTLGLPLQPGASYVARAAGDVDDDGHADLIVGSPSHSGDAGRVIVLSGRTGAALHLIEGSSGSRLGAGVAGVGDVNGDGHDDFAAGAPRTTLFGSPVGAARVYSGASGAVLYTRFGTVSDSNLGAAVAGAGDVDGDGFGDLLIGAPGTDQVAGSVLVVSPHLGTLVRSHTLLLVPVLPPIPDSLLGIALAGLGDLNGDGRADYAAGAPGADVPQTFPFPPVPDAGTVQCWSGLDGSQLFSLRPPFPVPNGHWGLDVAPAGDLDGDGVSDVLVGGMTAAAAYSGATGDLLLGGGFGLGFAGRPSCARMADQDGDGLDDCAIGAPYETGSGALSGSVQIFRAQPQTLIGLLTPDSNERFGHALAIVPDVDGDGLDDLLVGAPFRDASGADAGVARLHSGASGSLLLEIAGGPGEQLGAALAALDDLTGDGVADLLVGVPFDMGIARTGSARVFSGATGAPVRTHFGLVAGERCGTGVASLGDVDGDGVTDYAVGSPGAASSLGVLDVGRVRAFSGAGGGLLWTSVPISPTRADHYGAALARVGDADGDGRSELVVGAPRGGGVDLLSGATGARLWHVAAPGGAVGLSARYGAAVAGAGDANGDGVPDVLIGAPGYDGGKGSMFLLSGVDGTPLRTFLTPFAEELGASVAGAGDVDNDGVPDHAAGSPRAVTTLPVGVPGALRVYSGATGAQIRTWFGSATGERFGAALAGGGDADGDGLPDLVAGAPFASAGPGHERGGRVAVPSPRIQGSVHYGAGTPGCAGSHVLSLGRKALVGGVLELRASGLAAQGLPVLLVTDGGFDPGLAILGGVLLHADITHLLDAFLLPPASAHLAAELPIPSEAAWHGVSFDAQLFVLWPGGCAPLPTPYSSSNGVAVSLP